MRSKDTEHQDPNVNHNVASMRGAQRGHSRGTYHRTYHLKDEEYMNKHTGTAYTATLGHCIHDIYEVVIRGALQKNLIYVFPEKEFRGLSSSTSNSNGNAR